MQWRAFGRQFTESFGQAVVVVIIAVVVDCNEILQVFRAVAVQFASVVDVCFDYVLQAFGIILASEVNFIDDDIAPVACPNVKFDVLSGNGRNFYHWFR